ncbi:uncharacterized protein BDR25DRAFT_352658 [Lindgomyces ingoldianus]|uniref:Uncharacterized protein n=1 Tax=Lindgomyces ingoldianus TaxID=673940 RepID=A0ACB6R295_9PLEO|nr:uncharacterized protein BDR25DRAFT_352658 [Lindgomyces ingoldianus]KAF2473220.1 hypothetical protein BDR25DRAFT_352658 [Lindgomyces ingoldianus]
MSARETDHAYAPRVPVVTQERDCVQFFLELKLACVICVYAMATPLNTKPEGCSLLVHLLGLAIWLMKFQGSRVMLSFSSFLLSLLPEWIKDPLIASLAKETPHAIRLSKLYSSYRGIMAPLDLTSMLSGVGGACTTGRWEGLPFPLTLGLATPPKGRQPIATAVSRWPQSVLYCSLLSHLLLCGTPFDYERGPVNLYASQTLAGFPSSSNLDIQHASVTLICVFMVGYTHKFPTLASTPCIHTPISGGAFSQLDHPSKFLPVLLISKTAFPLPSFSNVSPFHSLPLPFSYFGLLRLLLTLYLDHLFIEATGNVFKRSLALRI